MTRAEQTIYARMMEILELVRSGATEMVGKTYRGASGKIEGRFKGGFSTMFPELERAGLTPGEAAKAINAKRKGKRFKRLYYAIADSYGLSTRKRGRGRLVVPKHPGNRRCKHCRQLHSKSEHRFHGPDSFHATHAFSFNPRVEKCDVCGIEMDSWKMPHHTLWHEKRGEVMSGELRQFKRYLSARGYLVSSMTDKMVTEFYAVTMKDAKARHDYLKWLQPSMTSEMGGLFQKNPSKKRGVVVYGRVLAVEAMKTQPHVCDSGCVRYKHKYRHSFKSGPVMYGLPDGSLLIKSR